MLTILPDRRAALKSRHRQAIVDAAASLMEEREGRDFTVEELALRADVSRRTVFNHFSSIDDVVAEVCSGVLGSLMESLVSAPTEDGTAPGSVFEELARAFRSADLVGAMAYLTRVLGGGQDPASPWQALMTMRTLTEVSDRLTAELQRRRPGVDGLSISLLVAALTGGMGVLYHHWAEATGAVDTADSRRVWDELLERLIQTVGTGHGNAPAGCRA